MRAIPRANAAMIADNRRIRIFIMADCLHHAGLFTAPAAYALVRVKQHAAAFAFGHRTGRANFGTVRVAAAVTNRRDKSAGKPAACLDMYAAFSDRVIFTVKRGTNQHTRKTPYTFIHFICFQYLSQNLFLLLIIILFIIILNYI
jgi:hypothetical protein